MKLLLVTVNDKLKFEIEIVHDLSCHRIAAAAAAATVKRCIPSSSSSDMAGSCMISGE